MRVIIAGCRNIFNYQLVQEAVTASGFVPTEIISGCAEGVDQLGEEWAKQHNVAVSRFSADWAIFGKSAGPIRNKQMASYAHALIALWDGVSRGTKNMIEQAIAKGLKVKVYLIVDDMIEEVRDFSPSSILKESAKKHDFDLSENNFEAAEGYL